MIYKKCHCDKEKCECSYDGKRLYRLDCRLMNDDPISIFRAFKECANLFEIMSDSADGHEDTIYNSQQRKISNCLSTVLLIVFCSLVFELIYINRK